MEQDNPFKKSAEPVEEVQQPVSEPATPEPTPEAPAVDIVKERYGIGFDELESVIQKANQYSWLEEDNFAKTLLSKYKEGTPIEQVVNILGKDWAKASDLDIIRESLSRDGITESDLQDYQIAKEFGEYGEDDDSPEAKLARKQLSKKASDIRRQLMEEQEKFGKPVNHSEKEMEEFQKQIAQWQDYIDNDPSTKSLLENKRITFKYDDREQNLEVDPAKLVEMAKSPGKFIERIGEMPLETQYKVAAFLTDPEQFIGQLVEIGKLSAKEALLKEERNPTPQPHIEPDAEAKFTDKPISEWTAEQKLKFLKEATVKR